MPEKANNHYVPKTHLKRFSNELDMIGMYLIDSDEYKSDIPYDSQCQKKYFYGKNNGIEDGFGELEAKIGVIFDKVIQESFISLNEEEITYLRFYIHTLSCRVLKEEDYTNESLKEVLSFALEKEGKYSKKESKEVLEKVKIKSINPVMRACIKTFDLTLDLGISLIKNNTQFGFLISDNPVVKTNFLCERMNKNVNGYGFAAKGFTLVVPISPTFCIILYDLESYDQLNDVEVINKEHDIFKINSLQYLNSYKTIYYKPLTKTNKVKKIIASNIKTDRMKIKVKYDDEGSKYVFRETEGQLLNSQLSFLKLSKGNRLHEDQFKLHCPRRDKVKPLLLMKYGPEAI